MAAKRVLHLIDTGGPGGAETIFLKLVQGLDPKQWESIAAVPWPGWLSQTLESRGIQPLMVPTRGSFDLGYVRRLIELVRARRIDLIQTHLLTTAVYASLAARFCGVPVVSTFHGTNNVSAGDRFTAAKFRIIDRANNRVVFVSESLRQAFRSIGSLRRAETLVVHNGIDATLFRSTGDSSFRRELGVTDDEILVGAVGNIRVSKAYPILLQAAALLKKQNVRCRVVIVGQGDDGLHDEVLALRSQLDLDDYVIMAGFRGDVTQVMNGLDLYVLSSSAEGFSLTTVQAMACGIPAIATRCGGPEEIVDDGKTGTLVDVNSPEALAAAIQALAADPNAPCTIRFRRPGSRRAQIHAASNGEWIRRDLRSVSAAPTGSPVDRTDQDRQSFGRRPEQAITMASVLVTDGEQRSALAVVRSLGRAGHQVHVASSRKHSLAGTSRYCQRSLQTPDPLGQPASFVDFIRAYVKQERIECAAAHLGRFRARAAADQGHSRWDGHSLPQPRFLYPDLRQTGGNAGSRQRRHSHSRATRYRSSIVFGERNFSARLSAGAQTGALGRIEERETQQDRGTSRIRRCSARAGAEIPAGGSVPGAGAAPNRGPRRRSVSAGLERRGLRCIFASTHS